MDSVKGTRSAAPSAIAKDLELDQTKSLCYQMRKSTQHVVPQGSSQDAKGDTKAMCGKSITFKNIRSGNRPRAYKMAGSEMPP